MLFPLFGCQKQGDSNNEQLTLDNTNRFTQEELQAAVEVVTKNFEAFTDCDLKTLHYEEALQEEYIEKHMQYSSVQGKDPANIIFLTSSFIRESKQVKVCSQILYMKDGYGYYSVKMHPHHG